MIIEPRMRGFICLTAHPDGCAQNVKNQIAYVKSKGKLNAPKRVLVVGASTGFGLASRITAAFGGNAATIGVFFEKEPSVGKTSTAGWYNSAAFEKEAKSEGLYAKSINGDAFSDEVKQQTIQLIKQDLGQIDLLIYSLASPVRQHPKEGVLYRSTLKPIGKTFTNKTVDFHTGIVSDVTIEPATQEDIYNTVVVMGGEDWTMWIDAMKKEGVLAQDFKTVAYSYIGPAVTEAVYRKGTIGKAKDHLEATAFQISDQLKDINGNAYVSVNKALVTQASSAIPVVPLYMSLLFKIMKKDGSHEGCIEQIYRLFSERLYNGSTVPLDEAGRIRIDDWEMRSQYQNEIEAIWKNISTEVLVEKGDLAQYKNDFLNLFGFGFPEIDYKAEANELTWINSIPK